MERLKTDLIEQGENVLQQMQTFMDHCLVYTEKKVFFLCCLSILKFRIENKQEIHLEEMNYLFDNFLAHISNSDTFVKLSDNNKC